MKVNSSRKWLAVAGIATIGGLGAIVTHVSISGNQATHYTQYTSENKEKNRTFCNDNPDECHYVNCDYIPKGKTVDEVCGTDFNKGLYPKDLE